MKTYAADRKRWGTAVMCYEDWDLGTATELQGCTELDFHQAEFEWGDASAGAEQLSRAILMDHFLWMEKTELVAYGSMLQICEHFQRDVIAVLPHDKWQRTSLEVQIEVEKIERQLASH